MLKCLKTTKYSIKSTQAKKKVNRKKPDIG